MSSPHTGVYAIDPLRDSRWPELIGRHPNASVFHTRGWLRALQVTYGYEPVAFTTSAPSEELTNALLFCVVRSWLTGNRLVSLPFSDHCEPLVENAEQFRTLSSFAESLRLKERWKYVEIRSANSLLEFDDGFRRPRPTTCTGSIFGPVSTRCIRGFTRIASSGRSAVRSGKHSPMKRAAANR